MNTYNQYFTLFIQYEFVRIEGIIPFCLGTVTILRTCLFPWAWTWNFLQETLFHYSQVFCRKDLFKIFKNSLVEPTLTLFRMGTFGVAYGWGVQKEPPS